MRGKEMATSPSNIPSEWAEIIDRVVADDRDYFQSHPGIRSHIRDYVPGEFYPAACPGGTLIKVSIIGEGIQTRQPLLIRAGRTKN